MEISREQMERLRCVEMDIFKAFVKVCEKLEIQYFVVQGTLLGAVRHRGFIPWDDDIDVGMLREDYDLFLRKGQAMMPEYFFIQTNETDPLYPHGFAKIRDSRTAFVETTCQNIPMNHGIYIDVFPFDFYPGNSVNKVLFELKKLFLRYRIRCELYVPADEQSTAANHVRRLLKRISRRIYPSVEEALEKQNKLYQSVHKGKMRINNGSPWGKKECVPAFWLDEVTELTFEGLKVRAPRYYREYLTHVYGDYMKLPPAEERVPHHYISVLDFDNPYVEETALPSETENLR